MKKTDPSQTLLFVTAIIMVAMVPIWIFGAVPLISMVSNKEHQQSDIYIGEIKKYTTSESGKETKTSRNVERRVLERAEETLKSITTLNVTDSIMDFLSHEVIFEKEEAFWINKKTGRRIEEGGQETPFSFPKNTTRKDYQDILYPIFPNVGTNEIFFSHEEGIFGLSVLVFRYKIELPDSKDKDVKDEYWGKIFVEPKTGIAVKKEVNWEYYSMDTSGEKKTLESGRLWQQDEEIKKSIRYAQSQKALSQLYEVWVPIYLLVSALALGIGFFLKGSS